MLTRLSDWYDWPFGGVSRSASGFDQLRRQMERVFSEFERDWESPTSRASSLGRFDLRDEGAVLVLRAELPGMTEKDLDLTVNSNVLTLRGQRKDQVPEGYAVHRKERSALQFARSIQLPCKIDPDRAEAALKNGVLTLTLPKAAEAQPKQITVKAVN